MIVTRSSFEGVLHTLLQAPVLSLDTETTGLRPYHGDRLFSVIIGVSGAEAFYFNFQAYPEMPSEQVLDLGYLYQLRALTEREDPLWFLQNAKFDMRFLAREGVFIKGKIHCTKAIGRVEYSDHMKYSLDAQLERIGLKKDDAVMIYIKKHKLWTLVDQPGKAQKFKNMHFDKVPAGIIIPYGQMDATGTFSLGRHQIKSIEEQVLYDDRRSPNAPPGRSLFRVLANERRLTGTIFRMEHRGCLIDRGFCRKAVEYEHGRFEQGRTAFQALSGHAYSSSGVLFQKVFADQKDKWEYTDKNNPSFESDVLRKFTSPLAQLILDIRDAKSKEDFYQGFLYHADPSGRVHPSFNPDGAAHGRFSSSEPNFQNLTDEEEATGNEFIVRRAIIPTPGFKLLSIDYKAMEYRFMLEMACRLVGRETPLTKMVREGHDVHDATAQLASNTGVTITRKTAKISNFLTLYGGGNKKLADAIGSTIEQAKAIREAVFTAAPEIKRYINYCQRKAETDGYIVNWLGRKCQFPNRTFAYKAPNYHCSGGCADIVKIAMNDIDELLLAHKSHMIMTVHDELVFEIAEGEEWLATAIQEKMETAFTSKYLTFVTDLSWSSKSLGDLE